MSPITAHLLDVALVPGDGRVSAPDPGTGHVCTAIPPQCGGTLSQDVFLKIFSILEKGKFK